MNRLLTLLCIAVTLQANTAFAQGIAFNVTWRKAPPTRWSGAEPFTATEGESALLISQRSQGDKTRLRIAIQDVEIMQVTTVSASVRLPRKFTVHTECAISVGEACAWTREDGTPQYVIERVH